MKKLILLSIFIVGCGTEPEDCAGVSGGNAVEDDCGVCSGIEGYVVSSCYDCADVANGDAVEDICGVCNGNGFPEGACNCAGDTVTDCAGVCGGDAIDDDYDGICDILQGNVTDIDGNVYQTIQIGEQLWMAENLKVTHYNDGSEIPYPSNEDWGSYDEGQYGVYDNDPANADVYGNLYNWAVVDDSRGVCPDGFHVPSDEEFMELEMYLGMSEDEANSLSGLRGTNEGSKLAGNSDLWISGDLENNSEFGTSGFSAFPAGYRNYSTGYYGNMGIFGYFWSSSEKDSDFAWPRRLYYTDSDVIRKYSTKQNGFSIRCIQD